jgi:hypothetical protein
LCYSTAFITLSINFMYVEVSFTTLLVKYSRSEKKCYKREYMI